VRIDVFTIFPEDLDRYLGIGVLGRARRAGLLDLRFHDLRAGASDTRRSVDDAPFGGGPGMVLMAPPVFQVVEAVARDEGLPRPLLLLSPAGQRLTHQVARTLADAPGGFSLLCGRYEGVDQRVADHLVDGELSVGDYVLSGGESAAAIVIEATARLVPGVLGNEASSAEESFAAPGLEYPQYTRPANFRGWSVPEVLLSGHHGDIAAWRHAESRRRTGERRPDLLRRPHAEQEDPDKQEAAGGDACQPGPGGQGVSPQGEEEGSGRS